MMPGPQAEARCDDLEGELEARGAELAAATQKIGQMEKLMAQMEQLHQQVGGSASILGACGGADCAGGSRAA